MIRVKSVFLFLCLFVVTGCATSKNQFTYKKEEFERKEKSVVFFDVQEKNISLRFELQKYGAEGNELSIDLYDYSKKQDVAKKLLFIEPGIYYISYVSLLPEVEKPKNILDDKKTLRRWFPGPGLKDGLIEYGAFEVKAGEVIHLPIVNIREYKFYLKDNYSEILQSLKEYKDPEIAELADKIIKSKFYSRGSMLILGKGNKPKLIPAEVVYREQQKIMQEKADRIKNFVR